MKTLLLLLALPLAAVAAVDNAADLAKINRVGGPALDENQLLATAEARIQQYRTGQAEILVRDEKGNPLAHAEVRVRLVRHEFKLGANAFLLAPVVGPAVEPAVLRVYEDRFAALLNFATLPFYWSYYEPKQGQMKEAELRGMAAWCRAHGIVIKGHPLAWHETFPDWAKKLPDDEVRRLQQQRITEIVRTFQDSIGIFDVINEATVSGKFDNAVGRWVKSRGAAKLSADFLHLAHQANPQAQLLYNDFNVSTDFEKLAADLLKKKVPFDALGIQSHMHKEWWPVDKLWTVCETYARFGKPLHFTELTILSGRFKAKDDNDWHTVRTDWPSTPEGEQRQLEYGRKAYTVLFSHPAVEAITWWDFSDRNSWAGAPAGLLRKDMTPKPLYDWLVDSFHHRWSTDVVVKSDAAGKVSVRAFYGEHEVAPTDPARSGLKAHLVFSKKGPVALEAALH